MLTVGQIEYYHPDSQPPLMEAESPYIAVKSIQEESPRAFEPPSDDGEILIKRGGKGKEKQDVGPSNTNNPAKSNRSFSRSRSRSPPSPSRQSRNQGGGHRSDDYEEVNSPAHFDADPIASSPTLQHPPRGHFGPFPRPQTLNNFMFSEWGGQPLSLHPTIDHNRIAINTFVSSQRGPGVIYNNSPTTHMHLVPDASNNNDIFSANSVVYGRDASSSNLPNSGGETEIDRTIREIRVPLSTPIGQSAYNAIVWENSLPPTNPSQGGGEDSSPNARNERGSARNRGPNRTGSSRGSRRSDVGN